MPPRGIALPDEAAAVWRGMSAAERALHESPALAWPAGSCGASVGVTPSAGTPAPEALSAAASAARDAARCLADLGGGGEGTLHARSGLGGAPPRAALVRRVRRLPRT